MNDMLDLTCRDVAEFLMAYLDRELDEAHRAAFEHHLAECDECVLYVRRYEATVRLGKAAFDDPAGPPDALPERLARAILAARK